MTGHFAPGLLRSKGDVMKTAKQSATIIKFPVKLARSTRRTDDSTRHASVRTRKGSIEAFFGDDGMTLIDACVPTAYAIRVLAELRQTTA